MPLCRHTAKPAMNFFFDIDLVGGISYIEILIKLLKEMKVSRHNQDLNQEGPKTTL